MDINAWYFLSTILWMLPILRGLQQLSPGSSQNHTNKLPYFTFISRTCILLSYPVLVHKIWANIYTLVVSHHSRRHTSIRYIWCMDVSLWRVTVFEKWVPSGKKNLHMACFSHCEPKFSGVSKISQRVSKLSEDKPWFWGLFTNTCKGSGLMQKIFITKIFRGPIQTAKNFRAPLFAMKITGQPHRKACNSIFNGKSVIIFFRGPLTRVKILRAPFLHQAPLTSVCEWSLVCL